MEYDGQTLSRVSSLRFAAFIDNVGEMLVTRSESSFVIDSEIDLPEEESRSDMDEGRSS